MCIVPPVCSAPPPATNPAAAAAIKAEEEQKFRAEQRIISLELWQYREELLGSGQLPDPPSRRWFYKDFFGDQQGPFNAPEMKERLGKKYVTDESTVLLEIETHPVKQEEETLRDLFNSPQAAFNESPRLTKAGGRCWFFLSHDGNEVGPFSNSQMKQWYDAGFFTGGILVKVSNELFFFLLLFARDNGEERAHTETMATLLTTMNEW